MGVMSCSRKGCENIMCDTYTSEGYICYEDISEFEELISKDGSLSNGTIKEQFKKFMNTEKGSCNQDPQDIDWETL